MIRKFTGAILVCLASQISYSQSFQNGSLSVVRIGTGESPLSHKSTAVFIDEYSTSGQLLRSVPLPVEANGVSKRLTLSGNQIDEGFASLSGDGKVLALAGYDASIGKDSVLKTSSTEVNRTVAIISGDGKINTSTAVKDAFGKVQIRSAVSNGNDIWLTGGGYGIRHTSIGSQNSKQVASSTGRVLSIFDGQLYASSVAKGIRIGKVGEKLPLANAASFENLPGFPENGSTWQYFFTDLDQSVAGPDVLYIADNAKGLSKYSLVKGQWVSNGSIGSGYFGLTAKLEAGEVVLYATQNYGTVSQLMVIKDNSGYNGELSGRAKVLVKAPENSAFRGVTFSPSL